MKGKQYSRKDHWKVIKLVIDSIKAETVEKLRKPLVHRQMNVIECQLAYINM